MDELGGAELEPELESIGPELYGLIRFHDV